MTSEQRELVWVQNLRAFIRGGIILGDKWPDIFVERLDATIADNRRLQEALAAAEARIAETRKKALEAAAQIADRVVNNNRGGSNPEAFAAFTVATEIARYIRSLSAALDPQHD